MPISLSSPDRREFAKQHLDRAIRAAFRGESSWKDRARFRTVLNTVQVRSDLVRPSAYVGNDFRAQCDRVVAGLAAITHWQRHWIRPIEDWEPAGADPIRTFSSLAHHLLTHYPVPPVLLSCWFSEESWIDLRARSWFCRVGQGESMRGVGLPFQLNKRMAHLFAHAPATMSIGYALRWVQVRGRGGSDELAQAAAAAGRETPFLNGHAFWTALIHTMINTPDLDLGQIDEVAAYLIDRRFTSRPAVVGDGVEIQLEPPEPEMSLKGRTFASLVRRAAEWRAEVRPAEPQRISVRWSPLGIRSLDHTDADGRRWTTRELLSSDALAAEGIAMEHCVATYVGVCSKGRSSIWSLGEETPDGRERLLTVEVAPKTRRVVQASRKGNDEPDKLCLRLLRTWAGHVGLDLKDIEPDSEPEPQPEPEAAPAEGPALALV